METEQKIKNLQELVDELNIDLLDDSIVKSNMLPFLYKEELYRVKMPTQLDLTLAKELEDKLKIKLLKANDTITRKALVKVLKEKQDIDIDALEVQKLRYADKLKDLYMSLATSNDKEKNRINKLKDLIDKTKAQHLQVSVEISDYLSPSIENQVEVAYIKYLTTVCTEKHIKDDEWKLIWPSQEDFEKDRSSLPNMANLCFSRLFLTLRS